MTTTRRDREQAARFWFTPEGITVNTHDWIEGSEWADESAVDDDVKALAALLAGERAKERERCAKVVESFRDRNVPGDVVAKAVRALATEGGR